jgi:transcriptional regulator with XRE-family HTH domain
MLADARRRARLSQRGLAVLAGTSQSAIARYERGATSPTERALRRLLGACGYDLEWGLIPRSTTSTTADPETARALWAARATSPGERVEANRRMTRVAAEAARSRRA